MEFLVTWGLAGLFVAAFLAATVLPFSSEIVFTGVLLAGASPWNCVVVATIGNWLGGLTCYWIGHAGKIDWIEKYLHVKNERVDSLKDRIDRYGSWLAFFAFLPGIGDVIAVAAGFFRCRFLIVAISMLLGKLIRYIVWMYLNGLFIS